MSRVFDAVWHGAGALPEAAREGACKGNRRPREDPRLGSAVAVLHRLADGSFGFKGSRRRRFRWAASRVSAWSQRGRLGVSPVEVLVMRVGLSLCTVTGYSPD